jgi:hypothetical protein
MIRHTFLFHTHNQLDADAVRFLGSYPGNPRAEILRRWISLSASIARQTTYIEFIALYPYIDGGITEKYEVRCYRDLPENDSVTSVFKEVAILSYKQRAITLRGHVLRGFLIETMKNIVTTVNEPIHIAINPVVVKSAIVNSASNEVVSEIVPATTKKRPDLKALMGKEK